MLDFLAKMLMDNIKIHENTQEMLVQIFFFLRPNWCKISETQFCGLDILFLELYINYYVKLHHYTGIIIHIKKYKD